MVFGEVVDGMDIVKTIENQPTARMDRPVAPCVIEACGEL